MTVRHCGTFCLGWDEINGSMAKKHAHVPPFSNPLFTHTTTGFAVDMWSLGIVLFILLTGVPPLELPTLADPRFQMIATNRLGELMDVWELRLSPDVRDLLARLLQVEPTRRATIAEVLTHSWVVTGR